MRIRHLVSLLLILAAGAFVLASDRSRNSEPIHHDQVAHFDHESHMHVAMMDMRRHAADHLGHATVHEHSFGSAPLWMAEWELHWLDVNHGDHHVRIYHATHAHHSHVRYVTIVDPEHHHTGAWTRVP